MCIIQPPQVLQINPKYLFKDPTMPPVTRHSLPFVDRRPDSPVNSDIFTVCTQCNKVLVPTRKNSAPSLHISKEGDQWIKFEDISKNTFTPTSNLSHGLCISCFRFMDALVDLQPSEPNTRRLAKSTSSLLPLKHQLPSTSTSTHVLVVDDNKLQRQIHKRMVEKAGFQCDVAPSGAQAIEMVQKHSYQLILMDLMMGGMDGWATSKAIRKTLFQSVGRSGIPIVVAVTGLRVDDKLTSDCHAAGMDDILQKPVSPAMLGKVFSNYAVASMHPSL